ncbi:MAG: response regulator transcription factor [Prevotella sp.]|jgi:DNA-binding LytR/AlgR family response regulator|nr:response regulator transcription factor [Prevotella sp.]
MTINCAIIDDEPLAAGLLESYAKKTPYLELRGVFNSAIQAMKVLRENPVQLLFLDIQMPELSGVEFAKILPRETKVIFTTAFPQYAIEGYKVSALDYLLKPISYEDFLKSTDKALEWFVTTLKQDTCMRDRFMFVKSDYKLQRVCLDDILYIEGLKDYVRFYLKNGERVMSLMSMKKLDEYLPKPEFLRTHRSYIVHMTETQMVDRFRIVFDDVYIPISDNYKEEVQSYFDSHTLA